MNQKDDLISRQDAIRIVDGIDAWQAGWRGDAIESIKALPSAQPETHEKRTETHACDYAEPPWIPCKKQLPVEEDAYFVTVDHRYVPPGYRSTDVITWQDGKWVMADYFVLDSEGRKKPDYKVVELAVPIIAWMPLPKEYQEDEINAKLD